MIRFVMCPYNTVHGVPTCADRYILQTVLREHWGWTKGDHYVTSDCDAVENIFMPHYYASTREEAVADALKAGTGLDYGPYYPLHLPSAYSEGLFDESVTDQSVVRLYSALIKLGYFDSASATPCRSLGFKDVSTPTFSTPPASVAKATQQRTTGSSPSPPPPLQTSSSSRTGASLATKPRAWIAEPSTGAAGRSTNSPASVRWVNRLSSCRWAISWITCRSFPMTISPLFFGNVG